MADKETDMELTPERRTEIKETLLRLFADQRGWDYDTMEVKTERADAEPG